MVFYRKYRSQTIDELDNEHVRETLTAVLSKEIPHAFLFTGPKGLGKTSSARIVAKAINCERKWKIENGKLKNKEEISDNSQFSTLNSQFSVEPCNKCDQCIAITNGTHLDIIELDAASNRGIDEIRELRDKIKLSPSSAKKKIYIIDEVHMLTTEAFNALLKTLEEPPSHAVFILCTTESHKVPTTILSRCFHIGFHLATVPELVRSFKRIAKGEKIDIDDEALETIAKLADGGFRDGAKILEELAMLANGEKITTTLIEEKYHVTTITNDIQRLLTCLNQRQTKEALQLVTGLGDKGVNIKYFLEMVLQELHQLLLVKTGVAKAKNEIQFTLEQLMALLHLFQQAHTDMKHTVLPQLPLELAIVQWGSIGEEVKSEVVTTLTNSITTPDTHVSITTLQKKVGEIARVKALYGEKTVKKDPAEAAAKDVKPGIRLTEYSNSEITKEWLENFWRTFIADVKSHNHTIAGVLRSCMVKQFDGKTMIIETAYKFHKDKLEDSKTRDILTAVAKTLTGNPLEISIVLKGGE